MTDASHFVHVPSETASWPIAVDWARLDDLCEGVFDCPHTTPKLTAAGPFVVRSQDVRTGIFRFDQAGRVSEETYLSRIERAEPRHGDLLFSREGTYFGNAAEVPLGVRVCLGQRMVLIRPKVSKLNPRFLRFWLNSPLMAKHIAGFKDGSVAERLNMPTIRALPVPKLHPERQLSIASVLGALDDKVELNRRMNKTLEAMARAIFKDWLVDFGPTRAKVEGRAPYLAPDIWSLFPDSLDDEGKPKGWVVVPLSALIDVNPSEQLARGKLAPYLEMASIPTEGPIPAPHVVREFGSGMRFRNGDALLARITPCLENGKTAFVQNLPEGEVGWGSTEFIVLRARPPMPKPVAYLVARDPAFRANAIRSMTGTSGRQRASNDAVSAYPLVRPAADELWARLHDLIVPMFERIAANGAENERLAATRDLLLPKLMSGEVRVSEASAAVEHRLAEAR